MSDGIRGVPPAGARAVTNFDKASEKLIKNAESLKTQAGAMIKSAGDEIASAGGRTQQGPVRV